MVSVTNKVDRKFTVSAKPLFYDKFNDLYKILNFYMGILTKDKPEIRKNRQTSEKKYMLFLEVEF